MKQEIIISGYGGQGVMLAGALLCYAGMKEGRFVTFFPSYGAEMRGGTANCQVIISSDPIGAPLVYNADILISFNKEAYEKFSPKVKKSGTILVNTSIFKPDTDIGIEIIQIPASSLAEKCGSPLVMNIVMVAAMISAKGLLNLESITDSIDDVLSGKKKKILQINKKAVAKGAQYIKEGN